MIIQVVGFQKKEAVKVKDVLIKLRRGIETIRKGARSGRVDADIMRKFVEVLRLTADYFEDFLEDNDE